MRATLNLWKKRTTFHLLKTKSQHTVSTACQQHKYVFTRGWLDKIFCTHPHHIPIILFPSALLSSPSPPRPTNTFPIPTDTILSPSQSESPPVCPYSLIIFVVTTKRLYHGITASYLLSPWYYREIFPIPAVIPMVTAVLPLCPTRCHPLVLALSTTLVIKHACRKKVMFVMFILDANVSPYSSKKQKAEGNGSNREWGSTQSSCYFNERNLQYENTIKYCIYCTITTGLQSQFQEWVG